jgi:hypothetical protein
MDNLERIKYLLDRFYEGLSSTEEEQELSGLLQDESLPEEFLSDRELFASFTEANAPIDVPEGLEEGIMEMIEREDRKESRVRRINIYSISGLAAGLLIILSVYLGFLRDNSYNSLAEFAVEDPLQAYEETKKALDLISEKWSVGTSELKNLNEVQQGIQKSVQPMQKLSSGSREINLLGNLRKAENIKIQ